jgi:hypothetical protein
VVALNGNRQLRRARVDPMSDESNQYSPGVIAPQERQPIFNGNGTPSGANSLQLLPLPTKEILLCMRRSPSAQAMQSVFSSVQSVKSVSKNVDAVNRGPSPERQPPLGPALTNWKYGLNGPNGLTPVAVRITSGTTRPLRALVT